MLNCDLRNRSHERTGIKKFVQRHRHTFNGGEHDQGDMYGIHQTDKRKVYSSGIYAKVLVLTNYAISLGHELDMIEFASNGKAKSENLIFMVEIEESLFLDPEESSLQALHHHLQEAHSVLCLSSGNLMEGFRPEINMINGVASALRIEMPFLKLMTFDLDMLSAPNSHTVVNEIRERARSLSNNEQVIQDLELRASDDVIYFSRVVVDEILNAKHESALRGQVSCSSTSLGSLHQETLQLDIAAAGIPQTAQYSIQRQHTFDKKGSGLVEIDVKAMSLSHQVSINRVLIRISLRIK